MIGLCLKYKNTNYGSSLQTFSFLNFLAYSNIDFQLIDYQKQYSLFDYFKASPRFLNKIWRNDRKEEKSKKRGLKKNPKILSKVKIRDEAFYRFLKLNFSKYVVQIKGYESLKETSKNYSVVISGSDQLLSPAGLGSHYYTLEFCNSGVKRVSYASSFGTNYIPWYQKKRTKKYLEEFNCFSVREESGVSIVDKLTGKKPTLVLDPVFLLTKEQWISFIASEPRITKDRYIFAYFLSNNSTYRKKVTEFAKANNYKIVTLHHLDQFVESDEGFGDFSPYDVSPLKFLSLLFNADLVCTDSFHGTSFSIILQKQFLSFYRYENNSKVSKNTRIDSILDICHLQSRLFKEKIAPILKPIDYSEVNKFLAPMIDKSREYLEKAIKND